MDSDVHHGCKYSSWISILDECISIIQLDATLNLILILILTLIVISALTVTLTQEMDVMIDKCLRWIFRMGTHTHDGYPRWISISTMYIHIHYVYLRCVSRYIMGVAR